MERDVERSAISQGPPIDADDPAAEREPTDGALNLLGHPPSRVS
jgi:hypothetical protein